MPLLDLLRHTGRQRQEAPHLVLARRGEDLALRFAEQEIGWRVVARNYRDPIQRLEIDMLAIDGETLVIAELKTRSSDDIRHPLRAVDGQKASHVGQAAQAWNKWAEVLEIPVRFDVLTVIIGETERLEYHRDVYKIGGRLPI